MRSSARFDRPAFHRLPFLTAALLAFACATAPRSAPAPAAAPARPSSADIAPPTRLEWIGEATLPIGSSFEGTLVGGLSGLVWSPADDAFFALSDDRAVKGPARFYRLRVDLSDGRLSDGEVQIDGVTRLSDSLRRPYATNTIDPEGFAIAPDGALFFGSEGVARRAIAPFVAAIARDGHELRRFPLPERYLPDGGGHRGIRDNLAFENLSVTPDGRFLISATENALVTDGPAADVGTPSLSRVLVWPLDDRDAMPREYAYSVDPVRGTPATAETFRVNGLDDILALDDERFLALEREFVFGVGMHLRLYLASLHDATEVSRLDGLDRQPIRTVSKRLLLDFGDLPVQLENFEGIALGPRLPDGRRSLLVVSDDNFDPPLERTRFLAFAWDDRPLAIHDLQGAGHRSPFAGDWVYGIEGSVTGIEPGRDGGAIYVESWQPDDDAATSEGIRVEGEVPQGLRIGVPLRIGGRVEEVRRDDRQLGVTTLRAGSVEVLANAPELPPAVRVGVDRRLPAVVEDDALSSFDPDEDQLDFWESLEGMRVSLPGGRVSGPTLAYGELVLAPDDAAGARSAAGGLLLTPEGPSPDRFFLSRRLLGSVPELAVGTRIAGPVEGIVDYSFSNYKVLLTRALAVEGEAAACRPEEPLGERPGALTVAAFNVENLSAAGPAERFDRLGRALVEELGAPAIVSLEEIEDDSGPKRDDGVTTSRATLDAIVAAVRSAGGPIYQPVWIDPEPDREGGIPGGNIRVALLIDPRRVGFAPRGDAGPLDAAEPEGRGSGLHLSLNPGRVEPRSEAFTLGEGEGVRRSLVVELTVAGRPLFVIANHWSSKWDDDRAFGAVQPPMTPTAAKRLAQSRVIRSFSDRLLAADPGARVVVLGDFNDVPWSPAVEEISRPPLVNLTAALPGPTRYSFNFEGSAQLIDHIVVSPALAEGAESEIVHLDSDCPDSLRVSDHDAVVARLRIR